MPKSLYLILPLTISIINFKNFIDRNAKFTKKNILLFVIFLGKILLIFISYFIIKNK